MELIAAVLIAGPLGYFVSSRKRARIAYLGLWAVIFPIQCVVVSSESGLDALYWVFNGAILIAGIGLNTIGARLREKRARGSEPTSAQATA